MPMNEENIQQEVTNNDQHIETEPLPTPDLTGEAGDVSDESIVADDDRDELEIKLEAAVNQANEFKHDGR